MNFFHSAWLLIRFYFLLFFITLYYFSKAFIALLYKPRQEVVHWVSNTWGSSVLEHLNIKVNVFGHKHLGKSPAILVTNHQSLLDFFVMCKLAPFKTTAIAKKSLLYLPLIGLFMKIAGVVFIDRSHQGRALEAMDTARQIIKKGYTVLIAPEGTRTHTGELQPLKKGAFYLALQTHLPMIPITIVNAYELFPRHAWFPKPGAIDVFIDSPIDTSSWTEETLPQVINRISHIFLSHLK